MNKSGIYPNINSPHSVTGPGNTTPSTFPCQNGSSIYARNGQIWNQQPWLSLKFGIHQTHYYQYQFESSGVRSAAVFTIWARSDLDCNGIFSTYTVRATVSPSTDEIERTSLIVTNALE
jgi:hypothetical protein